MSGPIRLVEIGKDALLVIVFVFQLSNFGRDTFDPSIELADSSLLLCTIASDVDGLRDCDRTSQLKKAVLPGLFDFRSRRRYGKRPLECFEVRAGQI
jgi:hypothetical protein